MFSDIRALIGLAAVVLVVLFGVWGFKAIEDRGASRVRAELQPQVDDLARQLASVKAERDAAERDRATAEEASRGYQQELEDLQLVPVSRVPVRLCLTAPTGARLPATAAAEAAAGLDAGRPAAGSLSVAAGGDLVPGPDVGPQLRQLVREADEVSARLRGLQAYCTEEGGS